LIAVEKSGKLEVVNQSLYETVCKEAGVP